MTNSQNSLALNFVNPLSALRKDLSWRPFTNWVRRPVKRHCAPTPFMRKAIALDVIFIAGCERKKCPNQFQCQSVNGKGATNPARRRSGQNTDCATTACADVYAEGSNGERRSRWAWHWCCSKFRAFVSARKRGVLLGVLPVFSKAASCDCPPSTEGRGTPCQDKQSERRVP